MEQAPCHPVSCEVPCHSVPCHSLVMGGPCRALSYFRGCKSVPCRAVSYHLCDRAMPRLALISCSFSGPCRAVSFSLRVPCHHDKEPSLIYTPVYWSEGFPRTGYSVPACVWSGRQADFARCLRVGARAFRVFRVAKRSFAHGKHSFA